MKGGRALAAVEGEKFESVAVTEDSIAGNAVASGAVHQVAGCSGVNQLLIQTPDAHMGITVGFSDDLRDGVEALGGGADV